MPTGIIFNISMTFKSFSHIKYQSSDLCSIKGIIWKCKMFEGNFLHSYVLWF